MGGVIVIQYLVADKNLTYLLWLLGIRQVVVVINKMDLVDFDQSIFLEVKQEYSTYLQSIGVSAAAYIPASARQGDNISILSQNMPWYHSNTLINVLQNFQKSSSLDHLPLRMPIQEVYRFTKYGDNRRIIAGRIACGKVSVGDKILFSPSNKTATIKSIESFTGEDNKELRAGDSYGVIIEPQIYIQRGQIISKVNEPPPYVSSQIRVSLFWMGKFPMEMDREYKLKIGTARVNCHIKKINQIVDSSSNLMINYKDQISCNEVADCILNTSQPIAYDISDDYNLMNRFVIVDGYQICGGGIITQTLGYDTNWIKERIVLREHKWIKSNISSFQRAVKFNQQPCLVIITGQKNSGRKETARILEEMLFNNDKMVYYLGIGSLLYGVDADLKQHDNPTYHYEYIRRMAEVVHLFLDAGFILILTAIELSQGDLDIIHTVIKDDWVRTIWLGDNITTDIHVNHQVIGLSAHYDRADHIYKYLTDHLII